jgi:hypothetical protein
VTPSEPYDGYLQLANATLPNSLVNDPLVTIAGLAAILHHSRDIHFQLGATEQVAMMDQVAEETSERLMAAAEMHPKL